MKPLIFLFTLISCSLILVTPAQSVQLRNHHPNTYVVQPGDTLWNIAGKFLNKPWDWKKVWRANPNIDDPNAIYPGDILQVHRHNGEPYITLLGSHHVRLSPQVDKSKAKQAIPTIPLNAIIQPFINQSLVVDIDKFLDAPYIVAIQSERVVGTTGTHVYARGIQPDQKRYGVYRRGDPYIDPDTHEVLGIAAMNLGQAEVIQFGDPAAMILTTALNFVDVGDYLLKEEKHKFEPYFFPRAPEQAIEGKIIALFDGKITQISVHQSVVINRGKMNGLQEGDVLSVIKHNRIVHDPHEKEVLVNIPRARIGEMILFRCFEHVSFGLIMNAVGPLHLHDTVINPA